MASRDRPVKSQIHAGSRAYACPQSVGNIPPMIVSAVVRCIVIYDLEASWTIGMAVHTCKRIRYDGGASVADYSGTATEAV